MEVTNSPNLDELAHKLSLNGSTLRGQKSRGKIPYDEIVEFLNAEELIYVLKGVTVPSGMIHFVQSEEYSYKNNHAPGSKDEQIYRLKGQVEVLKQVIIELKSSNS